MTNQANQWSVKVDKQGVVYLTGEIDYTVTPKLRSQLINYINKTKGPLNMNIGGVNYLDSSGLAVFIEARRHLQEQDRSINLINVTDEVKKIFELTQVGQLFGL